MEQIKRFFECLIPGTVCNLECSYCYIIQENRRSMKLSNMPYSADHIAKALRRERVGGTCLISICGAGETLTQKEVPEIAAALLREGHFVNITTNGTLTQAFERLIDKCADNISHLHVSFSFHYVELKNRNMLDAFFHNINLIRNAGASFLYQFNLCDEYIPYLDDIKQISMDRVGALPQVALTRDESSRPMKIMSMLTDEEYYNIGKQFSSPLFDFTYNNFNVRRKEFCYAGDWSGVLNLQTGVLQKCYQNPECQNIFEDIEKPIKFEAVGKRCGNCYCINSSHFMSLGIIPEIETPTYSELRNRPEHNWHTPEMKSFLNTKLYSSNKEYSKLKKFNISTKGYTLKEKLGEIKWIRKTYHKITRK